MPVVPKSTQKATDWAVGVCKQWLEHQNVVAEKKCPTEILNDVDENLCHWLCVFVLEIRKDNREEYTPRRMTQILSGLQRFINSKRQPDNQVKLCDPSSHQFRELHSVFDWHFQDIVCGFHRCVS